MSIEKKTVLINVETADTLGTLRCTICFVVVEGKAVLGSRTHYLTLEPGRDVAEQIAGFHDQCDLGQEFRVPPQFAAMGFEDTLVTYPALEASHVDTIKSAVSRHWTPDILAAARKRRDDAKREYDRQEAERQAREANDKKAQEAAFAEMADRLGFVKKKED